MFTSIKYVLTENLQNIHRIRSIAKYEILADMRDSKLGVFWNFANPVIQVLTYWFVFGYVFNRKHFAIMSAGLNQFFSFLCRLRLHQPCNVFQQKAYVFFFVRASHSVLPVSFPFTPETHGFFFPLPQRNICILSQPHRKRAFSKEDAPFSRLPAASVSMITLSYFSRS